MAGWMGEQLRASRMFWGLADSSALQRRSRAEEGLDPFGFSVCCFVDNDRLVVSFFSLYHMAHRRGNSNRSRFECLTDVYRGDQPSGMAGTTCQLEPTSHSYRHSCRADRKLAYCPKGSAGG
jgi:hypothetical protein